MTISPVFRSRYEAGRELASVLWNLKSRAPVILALPYGGIPVAFEVAKTLQAPLDILREGKDGLTSRSSPDLTGRTVIMVDDGVATSDLMKEALQNIEKQQPKDLILAVPIAPVDTLDDLSLDCDGIICLHTPMRFGNVGFYYADFRPVTDDEVIDLLSEARTKWGWFGAQECVQIKQ